MMMMMTLTPKKSSYDKPLPIMRDCAQKVLEEFPNGIYFMKFLKYFKGHLGRDPKKRRKRLGFPTFARGLPYRSHIRRAPKIALSPAKLVDGSCWTHVLQSYLGSTENH